MATAFNFDTMQRYPNERCNLIFPVFISCLTIFGCLTILEGGRLIRHELMDTAAIDTECEELLQEMDVVAGLIQRCINENAVKAIDQDEYISRYNSLVERHEKAQNRYDTLQKKRDRRLIQADVISGFLFAITELDTLQLQFDPVLWHTTIDHVTVYADERLVFQFKNGSEIRVEL